MQLITDIAAVIINLIISPLGIVTLLALLGYILGKRKAASYFNEHGRDVHSLPFYNASYVALAIFLPAILFLIAFGVISPIALDFLVRSEYGAHLVTLTDFQQNNFINDVFATSYGNITSKSSALITEASLYLNSLIATGEIIKWVGALALAIIFGAMAYNQVSPRLRARNRVEVIVKTILIICSIIAILTTIGIVLSLLFESLRFFQKIPVLDFLFGMHWSPQTSIRPGQVSAEGSFGAIPLIAGTLLITFIAMIVAGPIGLMSAIFLSDYASPKFRAIAKPVLEILAGIPTVVYGFFAALTVAPLIRGWGESIGLSVSSESALAAGLVMGIMIIPLVSSLSDDVINSVPQAMRDGSYGLGATKSETIRQVVLPAALPGIVSAMLLAISRAVGETMIVVMAAGLAANLTINPLEAVTTVTVQIVTLLVGDQEFDSAKTLAAFALGLLLFIITLTLNVIALRVVQKYREQYE
jgi:phosphate transport system permease protein